MKLKLLAIASSQTYQLLFVLSLNSCWHLLAGLLAPLEPFLTTRSVVRLSLSCWRAISWQVGPCQPLQCQFSKTPSWYILERLKTLGIATITMPIHSHTLTPAQKKDSPQYLFTSLLHAFQDSGFKFARTPGEAGGKSVTSTSHQI